MSGGRTTYDVTVPDYVDEAEVRTELSRTFDVCGSCRACVDRCQVFPTLFDLLDGTSDGSAGSLTPDEQDRVIGECFVCDRCRSGCPYSVDAVVAARRHPSTAGDQAAAEAMTVESMTPEPMTAEPIDVPRLALRTRAMYATTGRRRMGEAVVAGRRARADAMRFLAGEPTHRSLQRWSPVRLRLSRVGDRFSQWFTDRSAAVEGEPRSRVVLVPTCLVEYQEPQLGRDTVELLELHGASCTSAAVECCGAPWLHAGDLRRFARRAEGNVRLLDAASGRHDGADPIVVIEPTCRQVIARSYVDHVGVEWREAARRVAARVSDPISHALLSIDETADAVGSSGTGGSAGAVGSSGSDRTSDVAGTAETTDPDLHIEDRLAEPAGDEPEMPTGDERLDHQAADRPRVVVHLACHDDDGAGRSAVDYLRHLGCDVTAVEGCAGIGGAWDGLDATTIEVKLADDRTGGGLVDAVDRARSHHRSTPPAAPAGRPGDPGRDADDAPRSDAAIDRPVIVGGCGLANEVLAAGAGAVVEHPISLIARLSGVRASRTSI